MEYTKRSTCKILYQDYGIDESRYSKFTKDKLKELISRILEREESRIEKAVTLVINPIDISNNFNLLENRLDKICDHIGIDSRSDWDY